jgi:glycosyltransferase involved in cell wall biosynthesis
MTSIKKKKILSICIPTYNRAKVLNKTLNALFTNPDFDQNLIEVIVSDNCSTDETAEVVAKYSLAQYYKNDKNVKDFNFSIALNYATGSYMKLFNDTLSFKKGALQKMLNSIEKHKQEDCNLFFYENMFLNSNCKKAIDKKNDFLKTISFYTTWIANFGCWREDFEKIDKKNQYAELQFVQVDWSYRIVENNKKTIIYFDELFDVIIPNKKGGYNVFDTFVNKYFFVLKQQNISLMNYEIEKYRLCKYFIYPWLITLFVKNVTNYAFDTKGVFKILFKKYWYEPYFYPMLLLFWFKKL